MIQTNVMGMYYVTKKVLPYLLDKNEGDIINVSSSAGLNGNINISEYSASKFVVIGMSESLMKEVRKNNIRVDTLTSSAIESDMTIELGIVTKSSEISLKRKVSITDWDLYRNRARGIQSKIQTLNPTSPWSSVRELQEAAKNFKKDIDND